MEENMTESFLRLIQQGQMNEQGVKTKAEGMNVQSPRLKVCNSGLISGIKELYVVADLLFMNATPVTDRLHGSEHKIAARLNNCC